MSNDDCCILCAETVTQLIQRSCCRQSLCASCQYRHIRSILDEVGGRRQILCPLGCGKEMTETEIRDCFRQEHFSYVRFLWGNLLYFFVHWRQHRHRQWWLYLHTPAERQDLLRYERWSKATAFAEMTKKQDAIILHCPATDCDFAWIVANPQHRRAKQLHEQQHYYFWYTPMRPETVQDNWVEPDFLNLEVTGWIPADIDETRNDARRMSCGKCGHVFCGLCRNPWMYLRHKHQGVACERYARKLPAGWDTGDMQSWASSRGCPGCGIRTSRIAGCNHMSCPCGVEWCYVCSVRWSPWHYSCVDRQTPGAVDACSIL